MDKETFLNLCDHLKRHENLQDTRLVIIEVAIVMFLLIVGHNVRIRVVVDRFQNSTEIITRHFKEVRCALSQLSKIPIRPSNMANDVSSYVASNPKYFTWFKVRFYKKRFINVNFIYINGFHDHCFNSLITINVYCCRIASVQLIAPMLVHGS